LGLNLAGGIALNMIVTRVIPHILILPSAVRLPLRLAIMTVPFGATYSKLMNHYSTHHELI